MSAKTKYYIVAAEALPEIFIKVAEAKRMMQTGEAGTVGAATRAVGISRSAFYKYKDAVQPFNNMKAGRIITFYTMLKDSPGVLSNVLSIFAGSGANITDKIGRAVICYHQPVHPHQRLCGCDRLGGNQRYGADPGGADGSDYLGGRGCQI